MNRRPGPRGFAAMLALSCFGAGNPGAADVVINPGDDVQSIVDASPAGTTYKFRAGIYREVSVRPKPGDIYEGEPGAILTGARLLTGWVADGAGWYVTAQAQEGRIHGVCLASHPRCNRAEDVFVNGQPLLHVDTLAKVNASSYFFDYEADQIHIGQDPTGQVVEASATPIAFVPAADRVTVKGFIVEKYANPAQMGAIGGQSPKASWVIEENIIRWNHGTGVRVGEDSVLRNNKILHNGQQGFSGRGRNIRVEGNEVAYNLWNGTDPSWEGGGAKIVRSVAYLARNNWVHHNAGRGLWTDINNVDTVYEYNTVTDNSQDGLVHEISYSARISDNIAARNGDSFDVWLWGSNILIQNSSNVEVAGNYVEVAESGGNGIGIIEQSRGSGMLGPWVSRDVRVQGNVVVHKGRAGRNGAVEDHGNEQFFSKAWGLRFDGNTYHAPNAGRALFAWDKSALSLPGFRSAGQEAKSVIETAVSSGPPAPRVRLHAEPAVIMAGQSSALTFESLLATRCTADWRNSDWVSGQIAVSPMETTDYSLTCHGEGGSVEATATVTVR